MNNAIRTLGILSIALWSSGPLAAQAPPRGPGPFIITGPVRVIEADTLEVYIRGARVGVRIAGINVPQGNTPCGREASAALQEMLSSGAVLDEERRLPLLDEKQHLRLFRVTTPSGLPVAAELARAGFAAANPGHSDAVDFVEIVGNQKDAQSTKRGCLWADDSTPTR